MSVFTERSMFFIFKPDNVISLNISMCPEKTVCECFVFITEMNEGDLRLKKNVSESKWDINTGVKENVSNTGSSVLKISWSINDFCTTLWIQTSGLGRFSSINTFKKI